MATLGKSHNEGGIKFPNIVDYYKASLLKVIAQWLNVSKVAPWYKLEQNCVKILAAVISWCRKKREKGNILFLSNIIFLWIRSTQEDPGSAKRTWFLAKQFCTAFSISPHKFVLKHNGSEHELWARSPLFKSELNCEFTGCHLVSCCLSVLEALSLFSNFWNNNPSLPYGEVIKISRWCKALWTFGESAL